MAITVRPSVPPSHASESEHRRQIANVVNIINQTTPDYSRTDAEIAAGVTPVDLRYPPGDPRRIRPIVNGEITINIPSDIATLQQAVDLFALRVPNAVTVLNIETGHALTDGLTVSDGDYGWVRIESEDAVVSVDGGFSGDLLVARNARMPVLACLIDMDGKGTTGYLADDASFGFVEPGCGVINAGSVCLSVRGSRVFAVLTKWDGGQGGSGIDGTCIRLEQAATLSADGATADNGVGNSAVYVSRASRLHMQNGSAKNASSHAVLIRRSWANIQTMDVSGAGARGVWANNGSWVNAPEVDASGCGTRAFQADQASTINAQGADASNCSGIALSAEAGSTINFTNGNAADSDQPLQVLGGSVMVLLGATTRSTDPGTPNTADTNVAAFNAIDGNNGVIWA